MTVDLIHHTWVDEDTDHDGGPMFAAVCEICPWSSRWVHADEYEHRTNGLATPSDMAQGEAAELGRAHEEQA